MAGGQQLVAQRDLAPRAVGERPDVRMRDCGVRPRGKPTIGAWVAQGLNRARDKMADAGVDPVAIETFAHYYRLLEHGETGMIPESTIEPLDMEALADVEVDRRGRRRGDPARPR